MKNSRKFAFMFGFALFILIGMQSCSVLFGVTGAVMDSADKTDYETPVDEGEGWIEPTVKNCNVQLALNNGKAVWGEYKGSQLKEVENSSVDVIIVKTKTMTKEIPINMISYTSLFKRKKNRAQSGFMIGLAGDILGLMILGFSQGFDLNLSGPIMG